MKVFTKNIKKDFEEESEKGIVGHKTIHFWEFPEDSITSFAFISEIKSLFICRFYIVFCAYTNEIDLSARVYHFH
jgi:hypothetical protein